MAALKHLVSIRAPARLVFEAATSPQRLSEWWMAARSANGPRGEILDFASPPYSIRMEVKKSTPARHVEWECIDGGDEPEWNGTKVVFEIEDRGPETVLPFTHGNWREPSDFMANCNHQWGRFLNRLKEQCEARANAGAGA